MLAQERIQNMSRIIAGYVPVEIQGRTYLVYDPTFIQEYEAEIYIKNLRQDMLDNTVCFTEDLRLEMLREKDLWNDKMQKEIEGLVNHQITLKKEIAQCQFKSTQKARITNTLRANEARVEKLEDRRNILIGHTLESFLRIEKYKCLLAENVYYQNKRLWPSWDEFETADIAFITILLNRAFFNNSISEKMIREIARTEPWRSLWKAATNRDSLFGKPVIQYTTLQRDLVYWSMVYDNVFENPECPSDDILENDDMLDAWFIEQHEKRKGKGTAAEKMKNDKIANAQSIGIFVDTPEDAEKVYKLNDAVARKAIANKEAAIAKHGKVEEQHLPEAQQELRMKMNQLAAQKARGK